MSDPHAKLTSLCDQLESYLSNCSIQNDEANREGSLPWRNTTPYLRGPQVDPLFGPPQYIYDNVHNEQRVLKMMKRQAERQRLDSSMREQQLEENNALMPSIRNPSHGIRNHEEPEKAPQRELSGFGKESSARQQPESPYSTSDPEPSVIGTPGYVPENKSWCGAG